MSADTLQAWATVITAIATLVTAFGILIVNMRTKRMSTDVTTVHKLVNQQKTDADTYQADLITALRDAGVTVPTDQSIVKSNE
jgi:hypothetical protein